MKRGLLPGLALLTTIVATPVTAAECDSVCMLGQVEHYFKALDRVSRRGATVDDVDLLLALLHPAVRYVHVEYEADFGRAEWRQAFIGNLERGAYANGPENEIRVLKSIPGKNHLAVEYSHGVVGADGTWTAGESYLVLFAFTEGRISLVKELW